MKASLLILMWMMTVAVVSNSQTSYELKSAEHRAALKEMMDSTNYMFEAETVSPLKGSKRNLSYGYTLKVSRDTISANLSYFGRAYNISSDPAEAGIRFVSADFDYSISDRKKGGWEVIIKPKDIRNSLVLSLTIFENGRSSLYVTDVSRQPISFDGSIRRQVVEIR